MAWQLDGRFHEFCNCKLLCPCLFDVTARPDEGWCGSAFTFDIEGGSADGVDLAGRKAVVAVNIPGTFAEANFTGRLYVDDGASEEQRGALEAIFHGRRGGPWGAVAPAFTEWLPTKAAPIAVQWGDHPEITVGDVGRLTSVPRADPAGRPTQVQAAEALAAFEISAPIQPALTAGSRWSDPDLRAFDGNSGFVGTFAWKA
jgi:hypothetical protein